MIARKYAVICESADERSAIPSSALDIIIEAETLDAVNDMAPEAVGSALTCLAPPSFDSCESCLVPE